MFRIAFFAFALGSTLFAQSPAKVDFGREIQPILREHCVECHGPSQQMRGLRLDRRRDVVPNRVGANGARIVPGDSAKSPVFQRISSRQPGTQMPPSGPLRPEQIAAIKAWIDQGAEWPDAFAGERPPATRWTPLMKAAFYEDAAAVRALLDKGANPNEQNEDGGTALMYAGVDAEKVKVLLERGANPNLLSGEGRTALLIAVGRPGSLEALRLMLAKGADVNAKLPDGRGALRLAIGSRDPAVVQLLLDHGVDRKQPPLAAMAVACAPCFDVLLKSAEPGDLGGAVLGAVRAGDLGRLGALLERGAPAQGGLLTSVALSPVDIPLDTIRTLIRRGAVADAKSLDFARRHGNAALVTAIREAGVREEGSDPKPMAAKPAATVRAAVERILPTLQRSDVAFIERAGCVSCHNNSLTALTTFAARAKGLRVDESIVKGQMRKIAAFLSENAERGLENEGIPGGIDTASYILLGLAAERYPADGVTDIWASYVKQLQSADGGWKCQTLRPPLESSDFEVTAVSIRALRAYGLKSQRAAYAQSVARAARWLEQAEPVTTEDHAYKILGLIWGGGGAEAIRKTAGALASQQRGDGGWGQIKALGSDAYATGQALVALREAKAAGPKDAGYRRGIAFLRSTQLSDGSWYVRSRAPAFQPYFDSDFPHGADQFISAAASNWAVLALLGSMR